ncbi:metal-dependent phosphohydrolase with GAF domain [Chitinispirillum alkaliphilum]|nr:metal-dependent phosphohydrolase with GAF domain [Chitinispirillum alkaliphilum]
MAQNIVLIGSLADSELELIKEVASQWNLEITPFDSQKSSPSAVGYISALPCSFDSLLQLFASQSIGFGERIPFFQKLETGTVPEFMKALPVSGFFQLPLTPPVVYNMIAAMVRNCDVVKRENQLIRDISKYRNQNHRLVQIGATLSYENDLVRLLELILTVSREIAGADAGSIYTCEKCKIDGVEKPALRFRVYQNDSVNLPNSEVVMPVNSNSIAGYVAQSGASLLIDDVDSLDGSTPYCLSKKLEREFGYRIKSMLTVPLKNMEGDVVGVLQLMNKKFDHTKTLADPKDVKEYAFPFISEDEEIILSIASYAAVSIERVMLYDNIKMIFEGFLSSSIAAIDARDRVTSGHSKRVQGYAEAFVKAAAGMAEENVFTRLASSPERVRQFKFAALLHDIGKIGVPEAVLTKEHRLTEGGLSALISRFEYIRLLMRTTEILLPWESEEQLDSNIEFIKKINKAGYLCDEDYQCLLRLKDVKYRTIDGAEHKLISEYEWECLSVRKGNLTTKERELINSHAMSTFRILSKIPWTKSMEQIPYIACHHHEKIDGTGYPHGLKGEEIPLESRILAVVDIYEALVAQDRPYKPKMEYQKALGILKSEVDSGRLDPDVYRFFVEKEIYKLYLDQEYETDTQ